MKTCDCDESRDVRRHQDRTVRIFKIYRFIKKHLYEKVTEASNADIEDQSQTNAYSASTCIGVESAWCLDFETRTVIYDTVSGCTANSMHFCLVSLFMLPLNSHGKVVLLKRKSNVYFSFISNIVQREHSNSGLTFEIFGKHLMFFWDAWGAQARIRRIIRVWL